MQVVLGAQAGGDKTTPKEAKKTIYMYTPGLRWKIPVFSDPAPGKS